MSAGIHALDSLTVGDLVFTIAPPTDRTTLEITVERDASLDPAGTRPAHLASASSGSSNRSDRGSTASSPRRTRSSRPPIRKQFVDGEGFAYLGRNHRLMIDDTVDGVRLDRGRFLMSRRDRRRRRRRDATLVRPHGASMAPAASRAVGEADGSRPVSTSPSRDLGYRWGSTNGRHAHQHPLGDPAARTEPHRLRHRPRTRPPQRARTTPTATGPKSPAACPTTNAAATNSPPPA